MAAVDEQGPTGGERPPRAGLAGALESGVQRWLGVRRDGYARYAGKGSTALRAEADWGAAAALMFAALVMFTVGFSRFLSDYWPFLQDHVRAFVVIEGVAGFALFVLGARMLIGIQVDKRTAQLVVGLLAAIILALLVGVSERWNDPLMVAGAVLLIIVIVRLAELKTWAPIMLSAASQNALREASRLSARVATTQLASSPAATASEEGAAPTAGAMIVRGAGSNSYIVMTAGAILTFVSIFALAILSVSFLGVSLISWTLGDIATGTLSNDLGELLGDRGAFDTAVRTVSVAVWLLIAYGAIAGLVGLLSLFRAIQPSALLLRMIALLGLPLLALEIVGLGLLLSALEAEASETLGKFGFWFHLVVVLGVCTAAFTARVHAPR